MAAIVIEIPAEPPRTFHCPACGRRIIDEGGPMTRMCKHVLFTYCTEGDDLLDGARPKDLKALIEKLSKYDKGGELESRPEPDDPRLVRWLDDGDLLFCFHCSGLACGPVSMDYWIGVRILPQDEDEM